MTRSTYQRLKLIEGEGSGRYVSTLTFLRFEDGLSLLTYPTMCAYLAAIFCFGFFD